MAVSHASIHFVRISRCAATTAGVLSLGGLVLATAVDWPLWVRGLATALPWVPIFVRRLAAVYQDYQWLALFYAVAVTQTAHFVEHVAQMLQIHILQLSGADARGIFGALDVEWVHFIWNMWVLLAALVLLTQFGSNRWLWGTTVLSGWHAIEHAYIFSVYVHTGVAGTPGLLSQGGAIAGGLPVTRPDLHFVYNLIETVPLLLGFFGQVRCMKSAVVRNVPVHLVLTSVVLFRQPAEFAAGELVVSASGEIGRTRASRRAGR